MNRKPDWWNSRKIKRACFRHRQSKMNNNTLLLIVESSMYQAMGHALRRTAKQVRWLPRYNKIHRLHRGKLIPSTKLLEYLTVAFEGGDVDSINLSGLECL